MKRCPLTYLPCGEGLYHDQGLEMLAPGLSRLEKLAYGSEELRKEAYRRSSTMSVQGVQPKISAVLRSGEGRFELVDMHGRYLLKPQHQRFPQLPENEDLTMRMAKTLGLEVPLHGMLWGKDGALTYFIKRFDRQGQEDKIPMEDFAQLAGRCRDTKYDYSMEKVAVLVRTYCTDPAIEMMKLFKRVLFCFVTGNEDMHLKNFSILNRDGLIGLAPSYDLLNSSIVLDGPVEEIALPLKGKKSKLTRAILVDYFGGERCGIDAKGIRRTLDEIFEAKAAWLDLIHNSFLSDELKEKYLHLLESRLLRLGH